MIYIVHGIDRSNKVYYFEKVWTRKHAMQLVEWLRLVPNFYKEANIYKFSFLRMRYEFNDRYKFK